MGHRLADALVANLNGDFDDELELNAEFAASLNADVIKGHVVETGRTADGGGPAESE
jgi:hypothetical protein